MLKGDNMGIALIYCIKYIRLCFRLLVSQDTSKLRGKYYAGSIVACALTQVDSMYPYSYSPMELQF